MGENLVARATKRLHHTKYAHLLEKNAWVSYRFKLWPGVQYSLMTLATTMSETLLAMYPFMYQILLILVLGMKRTLKYGWRSLSRASGGLELFSLPIEQMICWINMLI